MESTSAILNHNTCSQIQKKKKKSPCKNVQSERNSKRNRKNSKRKNKRKKIETETINIISSYDENETALFKMSCEEYCEDDYYDNTDDADFVNI